MLTGGGCPRSSSRSHGSVLIIDSVLMSGLLGASEGSDTNGRVLLLWTPGGRASCPHTESLPVAATGDTGPRCHPANESPAVPCPPQPMADRPDQPGPVVITKPSPARPTLGMAATGHKSEYHVERNLIRRRAPNPIVTVGDIRGSRGLRIPRVLSP